MQKTQTDLIIESLVAAGLLDEEDAKAHIITGTPQRSIPLALRHDATPATKAAAGQSKNWAIGLTNAAYYKAQAKKTGKPWLHCARSTATYSEYIVTDRNMAEVAMEVNRNIRRLKPQRVERYSRDMSHNRWIETNEAIAIDEDGFMRNGQHRMLAAIQSDEPTLFYWSFNVNRDANFVYDGAAPRSTADRLGLVMQSNIKQRLPSICRAMMRGVNNMTLSFSDPEIALFATKHGPPIEWAAKECGPCRSDVAAVIAKTVLYHGIASIESFCQRFRDRVPTSKDDPAKRLWEWLSKKTSVGGSNHGPTTYRKALGAVLAELEGRSIKSLYEKQRDIFEWDDDWEVPAKN